MGRGGQLRQALAPAMTTFCLADANSFYAECERLFRPDLAGRPIIVLSHNDGAVVARSAEAKALGIPGFVPFFEIAQLCKKHDVCVFSGNLALYSDLSRRLMTVLAQWGVDVECYSIDEAFLTLDGVPDQRDYARRLRADVLRRLGLPIGIGIGPTKTLAKLANRVAKTQPRTGGVFAWEWLAPEYQTRLMARIPVGDVWGVGRRLSEQLQALQIQTALDLKQADPRQIRRQFSVVLQRTIAELNGESCLVLEEVAPAKQQIICSRSFGQRVTDRDTLAASISHHIARGAEKLRAQRSVARMVAVSIHTNRFGEAPQHHGYTCVPLVQASDDTLELNRAAQAALRTLFRSGFQYQKAGIVLLDIAPREILQPDLFAAPPDPRRTRLMATLDQLNRDWGRGTVRIGAEGLSDDWRMRQQRRSPCYSTRLDQLLIVE